VRALATAFNDMQKRIKMLLDDRTHALAAVSHDLRTPLTRLRLRTEDITDAEARAAVTGDLDTMERMIDQTLAYLRGDKTGEAVTALNLTAILQTIVDDAADAGTTVAFLSPGPVAMNGRHLALRRCFENIIGNAVKHGEAPAISLSVADGQAVVRVSDHGPGIADANKARVFEPFSRLDTSRNADSGGFGLGLAIARQAVLAHGGTIELSDNQPSGLIVTVRLPLKLDANPA
jgi:signal transduction histidine kinase